MSQPRRKPPALLPRASAADSLESPPAAAATAPPPESPGPEIPFDPVPVALRRDGWTAAKQRAFIRKLAETGLVSAAAASVGMSESSAYRLARREDADAFCHAWDTALLMAARQGTAKLFEYALDGMVETVWRDGEIVWQRRRPSEKALFFMLSRLDRARFGGRQAARAPGCGPDDPVMMARVDFDRTLDMLFDLPAEEEKEDAGSGDGTASRGGGAGFLGGAEE